MPRLTVLLASLLFLGACQSTGTEKATSTVDELSKLQAEFSKGRGSIDAAVTALKDLVAEGGDMEAEYEVLGKAIADVGAQRGRVDEIQQHLRERARAFNASWTEGRAQIQDASLKKRAMDRQHATVSKLEKVQSQCDEIATELDDWYGQLEDVHAYLEHDLNASGVDSIKEQVEPIEKTGGEISDELEDLANDLGALIEELEATKSPTPTSG